MNIEEKYFLFTLSALCFQDEKWKRNQFAFEMI